MLDGHFFAEDFTFIRYLGAATGGREIQAEVLSFQDTNRAGTSSQADQRMARSALGSGRRSEPISVRDEVGR
jgi:hypothetical protein